MNFGARIRAIRQERGLTQEELAHRAGLSLKSVYFIETGRSQDPHYSSLKAIASALRVPLIDLLEDKAPPSPEVPDERRRTELGRLGELLEDIHEQLEQEAARYKSAGDLYDLETFTARAHLETQSLQRFVDNEVRPGEEVAALRASHALERMNELVADLIKLAQASREAEQRRPRFSLIEGAGGRAAG